MNMNADAVYLAYLAGYLGSSLHPRPGERPTEETAAYALGVYWRGEPAREPEPLASVVRKVEKLLSPVEGDADKDDASWFTDPSGARLRRAKGTR